MLVVDEALDDQPLPWVYAERLEDDRAEDDESASEDVVPEDGLLQVHMCEECAGDDSQTCEKGDRGDREPLDRAIECEDVEEACDEPKAEERWDECKGKRLYLSKE